MESSFFKFGLLTAMVLAQVMIEDLAPVVECPPDLRHCPCDPSPNGHHHCYLRLISAHGALMMWKELQLDLDLS